MNRWRRFFDVFSSFPANSFRSTHFRAIQGYEYDATNVYATDLLSSREIVCFVRLEMIYVWNEQ